MTRTLILLLLIGCSSLRKDPPVIKKTYKKTTKTRAQVDKGIIFYLKKEIPRTGTLSQTSEGDVTKEFYRREKSESIFTLEKGELRTEVEKMEDGKMLTRTWQDGKNTTLTLTEKTSTTMVILDGDGNFVQKIITKPARPDPHCWEYEGKKAFRLKKEDCLELLSGFD